MTRCLITPLLVLGLAAVGLVVAQPPAEGPQEPPIRLQKKRKPPVVPPKEPAAEEKDKLVPEDRRPEPRGDQDPLKPRSDEDEKGDNPPARGEDAAEIVNRVQKNMRTSEDRLANKELGEGTQQVQRDILKGLDELIDQQEQQGGGQDQDPSSSSSRSQQQQQQQQQSGRASSGSRQQGGRQGSGQQRAGQPSGQRGGGQPGNPQQPGQPGQPGPSPRAGDPTATNGNDPPRDPPRPPDGANEDLAPMKDPRQSIWGHLPLDKRAQMDAYSREKFMEKYKGLIEQYYATLAEKSRRKGE